MSLLKREDSMVNKDNTSKLANIWETKLSTTDEKGVRKSQAVDRPDEIVVVKPPIASISSTDSSPTTVTVRSSSKPLPPLGPPNISPTTSTRGIVESFEKRASENRHEKPLAPITPTLGVALRPIKSDLSQRPSGSFSRRASSLANSVDVSVEDLQRKLEAVTSRVTQLESQVSELETKVAH